uniref:NADH dehydrogenase subunit 4L n=1 Tax=Ophiacantha linea TaxID=1357420 RepID=V9NJN3_9ECHI|nr:NADH dehydrogenase subunit 4L [Ophiacantha linea]AGQ49778.1 NADH dehydrogenase subunit 4L [Ophiacantha linea]
MNFIYFCVFVLIPLNILSLNYNKNFLLSILLALESILLIITTIIFIISIAHLNFNTITLSLYIITLSAIEASIGISILTLISRNFNICNINNLNILKN